MCVRSLAAVWRLSYAGARRRGLTNNHQQECSVQGHFTGNHVNGWRERCRSSMAVAAVCRGEAALGSNSTSSGLPSGDHPGLPAFEGTALCVLDTEILLDTRPFSCRCVPGREFESTAVTAWHTLPLTPDSCKQYGASNHQTKALSGCALIWEHARCSNAAPQMREPRQFDMHAQGDDSTHFPPLHCGTASLQRWFVGLT